VGVRPAMTVSRTGLPNKRFEAGGARRLWNESFVSAPQRKRDPLGGTVETTHQPI
jgi:hypothetical protein